MDYNELDGNWEDKPQKDNDTLAKIALFSLLAIIALGFIAGEILLQVIN